MAEAFPGASRWATAWRQAASGVQGGGDAAAVSPAQTLMAERALAQFRSKWRPRLEFQMAKVVISYLQVVAVVRDVDLRFPARLQQLFAVQGTASGWARAIAWDCLLPRSSGTWLNATFGPTFLILLLPFAYQALWSMIWILWFLWDRVVLGHPGAQLAEYLWKRVIVTALCVAFVFYPVTASGVLSIFTCIDLPDEPDNAELMPRPFYRANTGSFWVQDTSVRCWVGPHRCGSTPGLPARALLRGAPVAACGPITMAPLDKVRPHRRTLAAAVGAPGLVFWCAGVPALTLLVLHRQRARLHQDDVLAFYGFLYAGYQPRLFFWEVAVMLRKFFVVAATSLVSTSDSGFTRVTLCLGTVWVFFIAQVRRVSLHAAAAEGASAPLREYARRPSTEQLSGHADPAAPIPV